MTIIIKLNHPEADPKPARETAAPVARTSTALQMIPKPAPPAPHPTSVITKDPPELVINYPRTGKRVLPAGITEIYIKQQKVRLPDGTIEEMYATRAVESCRCFALYTDRMLDIRISMGGGLLFTSSVFPAWFRKLDMLEFDIIEVECTEPTTFYIVMSEKPDGVPEHHPENWLSPKVELGYNGADDMVTIRKSVDGVTRTRLVDDPDVTDKVVAKWIEYGAWTPE